MWMVFSLEQILIVTSEKTNNERIILVHKEMFFAEMGRILKSAGFEKSLTRELPDFLVRLFLPLFTKQLGGITRLLGREVYTNKDKANGLFNEALSVRTAENFPFERASTLINQIELYWLLNNENSEDEINKINKMKSKLDEVKQLTTDASMLEKVAFHEEKIESLKSVL